MTVVNFNACTICQSIAIVTPYTIFMTGGVSDRSHTNTDAAATARNAENKQADDKQAETPAAADQPAEGDNTQQSPVVNGMTADGVPINSTG